MKDLSAAKGKISSLVVTELIIRKNDSKIKGKGNSWYIVEMGDN